MRVIKHDGSFEELDITKATKSLEWAIEGLENVSISDIEMSSKLHFYDMIPTSYILDTFIKTTYDMSEIWNDYDIVCRNLKLQKLYKEVYCSTKPYSLQYHIDKNLENYGDTILLYTNKELEYLNSKLVHKRDFDFTASGLIKLETSYGLKNVKETPQLMFMLIAMDAFYGYDYGETDLDDVVFMYDALSQFKITLPTPEMQSLRTNKDSYASCCTVSMGNSIDSWNEATSAIVSHTVASQGVGINIASNSSIGNLVKDGSIKHGGKIPIIKDIEASINKAQQEGRRGSGTVFINFFDPEIINIFALKSPRTSVESRVNDLSYGVNLNQLVYDRAIANKPISLFHSRVPNILDTFYSKDYDSFVTAYELAEEQGLYSDQISARTFFEVFATEKFENSSYYTHNIDESNANTPYYQPIKQSNICVEFLVPTKDISSKHKDRPDIGICSLGNINQKTVTLEELPLYTKLMVKLQTYLGTRQWQPTPQARAFVSQYRDIGIGISNHAYWLADQGLKYGEEESLNKLDEYMEHFSYYLIQASIELTHRFGIAPRFIYSKNILPINRYKKTVDELVSREYSLDWDLLDKKLEHSGMANCGLSMIPPSEGSSIPSNQTSSLEPIKKPLTIKSQKPIDLKQFAPEARKLEFKYDYAFDRKITRDFIKHVAIVQKWTDKGISSNTFYNPELYTDNKVDIKDIVSDMYYAKYFGLKTGYYQNTKIKDGQELENTNCSEGGCSV